MIMNWSYQRCLLVCNHCLSIEVLIEKGCKRRHILEHTLCYTLQSTTPHCFSFKHTEQSPSWKRAASLLKGPVRLAAGILNTYVCDSALGSVVAVRAKSRSTSSSILCRKLIHAIIEQRQDPHEVASIIRRPLPTPDHSGLDPEQLPAWVVPSSCFS